MNIVAIVQARTGSTRFPGKVFALIEGKPLIWHIFNRIYKSQKINNFVLATTLNNDDDQLEAWAVSEGIEVYRGSENNVLERYYLAALKANADIIVRITSDDPFKDPELIDNVIEMLIDRNLDFAYNNKPPTFPEGLDTEVFRMECLKDAFVNAISDFDKEHVTQYFYKNPLNYKLENLSNPVNLSHLRWTIDTELDYKMVCQIYKKLFHANPVFSTHDILQLLKSNPEIAEINSGVQRSELYKNII